MRIVAGLFLVIAMAERAVMSSILLARAVAGRLTMTKPLSGRSRDGAGGEGARFNGRRGPHTRRRIGSGESNLGTSSRDRDKAGGGRPQLHADVDPSDKSTSSRDQQAKRIVSCPQVRPGTSIHDHRFQMHGAVHPSLQYVEESLRDAGSSGRRNPPLPFGVANVTTSVWRR